MIERMDEMDQAVYQMCLTLLKLENEEDYAKRFPWNIGIVEEIKESAIQILNENQYRVCHPFIQEEEGNREFCGLDSCGLSELDKNRQAHLLETIQGIQTFITCTGTELIQQRIETDHIYDVSSGCVKHR